jgi:benzoate/toluate 1,2-dioxygenase subunit alpha
MITDRGAGLDALAREDMVHRRVYTDPAVFDAEMQRIFGGTWVFVGHESEVPGAGDFKTDNIGGQPIIMARHGDGQVHVLFNACRHRGALVCADAYGKVSHFRCPYHAWTYLPNGQLTGVPYREGFAPDFDPRNYPLLRPPRVDSYRGFIFASLTPDVPDLRDHLGRATHYIDLMVERAPEGRIAATRPVRYEYPGNWKLQLENYADNYHPLFVHASAYAARHQVDPSRFPAPRTTVKSAYEERSLGAGHGMAEFGGSRPSWLDVVRDPGYVAALAERHGEQRARELAERDVHVIVYPNLLLHVRLCHYRVVKPIAVDRTEVHAYPCRLLGAPDAVNEKLIQYSARHVSAGGEVQVDDLEAFARVQTGLRVQALEWVLFKLKSGQEYENEHGERVNEGISEMLHRGQYTQWRRLMAAAR